MLAHWLERGLGQLLAPDASYDSPPAEDTGLWQIIAPDPSFSSTATGTTSTATATPPPHAFRQQPLSAAFSASSQTSEATAATTPMSIGQMMMASPKYMPLKLKQEVFQASQDTALMANRNPTYKENAKFILMCAACQKKKLDPRTLDKLKLTLKNDLKHQLENSQLLLSEDSADNEEEEEGQIQPPLYEARAYGLGAPCPVGYTPLQAAMRTGSMEVAEILLQHGSTNGDNDNNNYKTILRRQLQRTNMFGQTAMHLAAESHREEMVDLIQRYQQLLLDQNDNDNERNNPFASPPPSSQRKQQQSSQNDAIDLMGRTPWGTLMTTPVPSNKKGKDNGSIRSKLFSPGDASFVSPAPAMRRTKTYPDIHAIHGTAHFNGMRVNNEDALFCTQFQYQSGPVGFFIVCDGHGDNAVIAHYVARRLPKVLHQAMTAPPSSDEDDDSSFSPSSHDSWLRLLTTACNTVELELKGRAWAGGCAAIFCLVTKDQIVVGNVGDSRCILVEHKPKSPTSDNDDDHQATAGAPDAAGQESSNTSVDTLTESMNQQLSLSGTDGSPAVASPPSESSLLAGVGKQMTVVATALSTDHKADLPDERARVEKSGLEVVEIKFQDEQGNNRSKVKVQLKQGNLVDFSRSFGDFDYKDVKGLPADEQAVVSIPEVRIIDRHSIAPESYLVLACDGVWDVKSNDEVASFVTEHVHERLATDTGDDILSNVGDDLLTACIHSNDNLSTIIVALSQAADLISPHQRGPLSPKNLTFNTTPQK